MEEDVYQGLMDLVGIFSDCSINGEDVWCFNLIKKIVDGEVLRESINKEIKILAQRQLNESFEWLQSIGVKTKYQEELLSIIN